MRSMSAPSEAAPVWHYDGASGLRRAPLLLFAGDGFVLSEDGREEGPFRFDELVAEQDGRDGRRFGLDGRPGWRIEFREAPPAAIAARLPGRRRYGRIIDRIGLWPAVAAFALLSALVVYGVTATPALLARMIPRSVETRLGDLMVGDFGGRTCNSEAGDTALAALTARMGVEGDVDVRVVNIPMVNAVTLPGGHVLLFRGLIDAAETPDEVAGVLGHEVGHVAHRHVLQSLLRQLGLSVVLGGLDGNVGGYTNVLLSASYSRAAESEADGYAIDQLTQARVSPKGAARFFERLSGAEVKAKGAGVVLGYLASHPASSERQKRFADAAKGSYAPALDADQWRALKTICGDRPRSWREGLGF